MSLPYKLLAILLVFLAAFGAGYYYAPTKTITQEVEKVVTRVDTQIVDHVITKTVERKPDGTTVETTTEEDKKQTTEQKDTSTVSKSTPGSTGPDYRIGARYWVGNAADVLRPGYDRIGISLGRRVLGPVWIDLEVNKKEVAFGIDVTF